MRKIEDAFSRQATREGYFARAVYKLEAIDRKFKIIKENSDVLDLGSAPGSWLQYLLKKLGPNSRIAAVDIAPVKPSLKKQVHFILKDVFDCTTEDFKEVAKKFDAVISDLEANRSGIRLTDQGRSLELAEAALDLAAGILKKGGNFTAKVFESPETKRLVKKAAALFCEASLYKPPACRHNSFEVYLVAKGFGLPPKPKKEPASPKKKKSQERTTWRGVLKKTLGR